MTKYGVPDHLDVTTCNFYLSMPLPTFPTVNIELCIYTWLSVVSAVAMGYAKTVAAIMIF
jgi:hypothetical protein